MQEFRRSLPAYKERDSLLNNISQNQVFQDFFVQDFGIFLSSTYTRKVKSLQLLRNEATIDVACLQTILSPH